MMGNFGYPVRLGQGLLAIGDDLGLNPELVADPPDADSVDMVDALSPH
jgi:hypothetical protein